MSTEERFRQVSALFDEAEVVAKEAGHPSGCAGTTLNRTAYCLAVGRVDAALEWGGRAEEDFRKLAHSDKHGMSLCVLGDVVHRAR